MIPQARLKTLDKCSWFTNPQANAISAVGASVFASRCLAFSTRRCRKY
jgi:hypothetical protein